MNRLEPSGAGEIEVPLTGGNMGGALRIGDSVRRPAGAWTPTIQRLLGYLHERGLDWVPQPLGCDEHGRDILTYLPGVVPTYPMPEWIWQRRHPDRRCAAHGPAARCKCRLRH